MAHWVNELPAIAFCKQGEPASCEMSLTELTNVAIGGTENFETEGLLMIQTACTATTETDKHAEVNACCVESCAALENDSMKANSIVVDDASLKPNPTIIEKK